MLLLTILYAILFLFCALSYLIEVYILKIKKTISLVIVITLFLMLSGWITYVLLTATDL